MLVVTRTSLSDGDTLFEWLVENKEGISVVGGSGSTVLELLEDIRKKWGIDWSTMSDDFTKMEPGDTLQSDVAVSPENKGLYLGLMTMTPGKK